MTGRDAIRNTAFHDRMAGRTRADAWVARSGFMVPTYYSDATQENLAAHSAAALIDFSYLERLRIHGKGSVRMLSGAFGCHVDALAAGESRDVVWRTDAGGVRGLGTLARTGEANFSLLSFAADGAWFQRAAPRFDVTVRDETAERSMLLLAGPYAFAVLAAAGLEDAARLPRGRHATFDRAGVTVTVGRWDPLGGFAILAAAEHATAVFDLLWRGGGLFGLTLAGQEALETLLLEAGTPLPGVDFAPARDDFATEPSRQSLSPQPLTPRSEKMSGGGQLEILAAPESAVRFGSPSKEECVLAGIEIESETPAPFAPLLNNGAVVGHTLRSAYSPVLRRAIALAQIQSKHAAPGTEVKVRTLQTSGTADIGARVSALPFLTSPIP